MCDFHRGDALPPPPVSDAAVQRTRCPRVKVIVLVRSGWTLGTERQAGVSPTRDRWRKLAEQPCESLTLFRARLREWLPAVSRSAN